MDRTSGGEGSHTRAAAAAAPQSKLLERCGFHCPRCGLTVTQSGASCPLCQASLIRVNARRVLLWSAVVVEFLLILVLHFRAGAVTSWFLDSPRRLGMPETSGPS
jgi:hypothetical protein